MLHRSSRTFIACNACGVVFVPPAEHGSVEEERRRYLLHDNRPDHPGYRAHLDRLATPLLLRVPRGAAGLDYGCGPGPTLSLLLQERGLHVALHDPLFAPNPEALSCLHDFVTATEVLEHLRRPGEEIARMLGLLRPGGVLAVMTQLAPGDDAFAGWHYHRDPTHVAFYRAETLAFVARRHGCGLELLPDGVAFLQTPT